MDLSQIIKLLGQPTKHQREPLPVETWVDARRRCWRITDRWEWNDLGRKGTDQLRLDVVNHAILELVRRWTRDDGSRRELRIKRGGPFPKISWQECRFAVRRGVRKLCTGLVGKLPRIDDSPEGRQIIRSLGDGTLRAKNMLAVDPLQWRSRDELTIASPSETESKRAVELGNLINGSIKLAYAAIGLGTITDRDIPRASLVLSFVAPELWQQIESLAGCELI